MQGRGQGRQPGDGGDRLCTGLSALLDCLRVRRGERQASQAGIWSGTVELPSEIRHAGDDYRIELGTSGQGGSTELPVVMSSRGKTRISGNCRIKGNHSRKRGLIYHLPGMPYYAETRAEAMFCTEAQARAASYRRSRADQHR